MRLMEWEWLRMCSLLNLMFSFLAFLSCSMSYPWLSFMLRQHLLKFSVLSLNSPSQSINFLFMILACTQKFFTFMPCALFSYFSRCSYTYSFNQCQVLDYQSRDLRSSTCFIRDSSRKDMRSFISLGNFFLQSYYSCFQSISFSYFRDFISRFKAVSDFFRLLISVVFSWSQLLTNLSYSFNLSSQVANSFSFLMLNFIFSSSLKPASRLSRITQSSNSIISLPFNYNSSLRSYWQSFPVEGCS